MSARASLTGSWSGAYRYAHGRETVFNAQIEEVGGAFVGTTQEPNEFADPMLSVLTADIEGVREGRSVTFTKFYHHGAIRHAIRYEAGADDALMRIEGRWTIRASASGAFFMVRDDDGAEAEAEEEAEAALLALDGRGGIVRSTMTEWVAARSLKHWRCHPLSQRAIARRQLAHQGRAGF